MSFVDVFSTVLARMEAGGEWGAQGAKVSFSHLLVTKKLKVSLSLWYDFQSPSNQGNLMKASYFPETFPGNTYHQCFHVRAGHQLKAKGSAGEEKIRGIAIGNLCSIN